MNKRLIVFFIGLMIVAIAATDAMAQRRGTWVNLGSKDVKAQSEEDTWHVTSLRGQFRRIKFSVSRAPVRIERVQIRYQSGQDEDKEVRQYIRAGGQTRNIDLDDRTRFIKEVNVWYETASLNPRRHARVTLWGMR